MKRPEHLLAIAAIAIACAAPAIAQKPPAGSKSANISGAWTFLTQSYANGCRMSGVMAIKQSTSGKYTCTFQTEEKCNDIAVRAKETCEAVRVGGTLTITSTVISVEPKVGYDPDHFKLTIQNSARMTGMMLSFNSAPVEFFRGDAPVS